MTRRPRALMIAPAVPDRTGNGLAMRLGIFLEALARVTDLDLVVLPIAGRGDAPTDLPASLGVLTGIVPIHEQLDTRFEMLRRLRNPAERLAAFRAYGRPSFAAYASTSIAATLRALGRERSYDLVHVGRLYLAEAGVAAAGHNSLLSLDLDEDDCVSQQSIAQLQSLHRDEWGAKWSLAEAEALERLLSSIGRNYDRLWISSPEDRSTLTSRHPGLDPVLVHNAVEIPPRVERQGDGRSLLFVGTFGYVPNVEGILWFAKCVWPRLRELTKKPLHTLVVGGDPPPRVRNLARRGPLRALLGRPSDFAVLGRVAELRPLYARAALAIAPLRAGRGTRLKLLEAAAEGVPIVATREAARGLPCSPPWAWFAEDADGFAEACVAALDDTIEGERRAARARAMVAATYDRAKVVSHLAESFAALLEEPL